ncbi:hypothetical protein K2173_011730 [Erythroxylum novogranatense]|uniref:DUF4408 domain-containing protein n=1 Tax=Erythroxylum novogranatense TaxID=1862640 RepID=A0AAV8TJ02_9ROSI|nr:hypothetical protein K2173_011730 [Erythroxylum novogranatense]
MLAFLSGWLTPASLFLLLNLVIGVIAVTSRFGSHKKPPSEHHPEHQPLARAPSLLDRVRSINFSNYKFPLPHSEIGSEPATTDFLHSTSAEYQSHVDPPRLERAPSFLDRVRSINFYNYKSPLSHSEHSEFDSHVDPPQFERAPSLLQRVKSINFSSFYRSEQELDVGSQTELDRGSEVVVEHHEVKRSKSESRVAPERSVRDKMKKSASEKAVAVEDVAQDMEEEEEREKVERRRPATSRMDRKVSFGDDGVDEKADDFINRFKQQLRLQRLDSLLRYKEMLHGKQKT